MRNGHPGILAPLGVLIAMFVLTGCGTVQGPHRSSATPLPTEGIVARLGGDIEALYLAWHALDLAHKNLKSLEKGFLFHGEDRQLGYVQKASLYVQDASVRIHHQWARLAVLDYIKPPMLRDYLTLCLSSLTRDREEIAYDKKFLRIYTPFITDGTITADLGRAMTRIDENIAIIDRLIETLEPVVNQRATPT